MRAPFAMRLGFRLVKGLGEACARRIERARKERGFTDLDDPLRARVSIDESSRRYAEAGALASIVPERRHALWHVRAPRGEDLFEGKPLDEPGIELEPLSRAEQLVLDFDKTGVSVADHPMQILRPKLPRAVRRSDEIARMKNGATVRTAGLVICRQRPVTARGVVFTTLEDEVGFVNLLSYPDVFERYRHVATTSALITAKGKIERDGPVVYVIVERLERCTRGTLPSMSRDFC